MHCNNRFMLHRLSRNINNKLGSRAGAIHAASNMIIRSRNKLNSYYDANDSMVTLDGTGDNVTYSQKTIVITGSGYTSREVVGIYTNNALGDNNTVTAYRYDHTDTTQPDGGE